MAFKDLSYWGIFKLSLIFEAIIPIILSPFLLAVYFSKPDALNITSSIMGITVNTESWTTHAVLLCILTLISLLIQSVIWYALAQKTHLGRLKISDKILNDTTFD
ncbi:MAG: hypothetical protein ABJG88_05770 [Litorimonas sp.]